MSVARTIPDAGVLQAREEAWPRRYLDETPPLGLTPLLEEATPLTTEHRKPAPGATARPFGNAAPAPEADAATDL